MSCRELVGTGAAIVTPFSDGQVDHETLRKIVDHLIDGGLDYLMALGTTGETPTLSRDEQHQVVHTILDQTSDRVPVWSGHSSGNDTATCIQSIADAQDLPLKGHMLSAPAYNKPNQAGLTAHFSAIADSTDQPILLYNNPGRSVVNISASTMAHLADKHKNIIGVKEATANLSHLSQIIHDTPHDFLVISGDDPTAVASIAVGAQGCLSVLANALPELFSQMIRHALDGDFQRAHEIHYKLWPLHTPLYADGNPAGIKCLMAAQGLLREELRLPLTEVSDSNRRLLHSLYQGL